MAEQDNVRIVQEAYAAFQRGDIQAVLDTLTDDVEWITPGPPDLMPVAGNRHGRNEVAQFFSTLSDTEEVELFEPQEYIAQGDKVVAFVKYRGRVKATGRTAESDLVHVFTMREGKVAGFREYFDTAAVVEAYRAASAQASAGT
jgi:ketosteroid isomerase-like protein